MTPRLSIIVVTAGRKTLTRTLLSIQAQPLLPQDEVLVVGADPWIAEQADEFGFRYIEDGPFGCYGQRERTNAMAHAHGTHLLFMDDDDYYLPGAFEAVRAAIRQHPDVPVMFKMIAPEGYVLWTEPAVWCGNHAGTQFVVPNDPARLGTWGLRREGDFDFIEDTLTRYPPQALVWHSALIAGCRDAAPTLAAGAQ